MPKMAVHFKAVENSDFCKKKISLMERQLPKRQSSHRIAVENFDTGSVEIVEADEIRLCLPSKHVLQFWVTVGACLIGIGLGTFFMIWAQPANSAQCTQNCTSSPIFTIGAGLIGTAFGVLLPGPNYDKVSKKTTRRREIRPLERQHESTPLGESNETPATDE